jgi:serine/threonine-protein kinase
MWTLARLKKTVRLLEEIGEGGMGTVWVAKQSEPIKRKVALKLIKAGMDFKHVLARFEAERQALAMMDHPNIARVVDAGMTDPGRPYFAMEYVKGAPLTEYCDQAKLSVKARLRTSSSYSRHANKRPASGPVFIRRDV